MLTDTDKMTAARVAEVVRQSVVRELITLPLTTAQVSKIADAVAGFCVQETALALDDPRHG